MPGFSAPAVRRPRRAAGNLATGGTGVPVPAPAPGEATSSSRRSGTGERRDGQAPRGQAGTVGVVPGPGPAPRQGLGGGANSRRGTEGTRGASGGGAQDRPQCWCLRPAKRSTVRKQVRTTNLVLGALPRCPHRSVFFFSASQTCPLHLFSSGAVHCCGTLSMLRVSSPLEFFFLTYRFPRLLLSRFNTRTLHPTQESPNVGKTFYSCAVVNVQQKCQFFSWASGTSSSSTHRRPWVPPGGSSSM